MLIIDGMRFLVLILKGWPRMAKQFIYESYGVSKNAISHDIRLPIEWSAGARDKSFCLWDHDLLDDFELIDAVPRKIILHGKIIFEHNYLYVSQFLYQDINGRKYSGSLYDKPPIDKIILQILEYDDGQQIIPVENECHWTWECLTQVKNISTSCMVENSATKRFKGYTETQSLKKPLYSYGFVIEDGIGLSGIRPSYCSIGVIEDMCATLDFYDHVDHNEFEWVDNKDQNYIVKPIDLMTGSFEDRINMGGIQFDHMIDDQLLRFESSGVDLYNPSTGEIQLRMKLMLPNDK